MPKAQSSPKPGERPKPHFTLKFYEGYKGQETPRAVVIGEREFRVELIERRRRVRDARTGDTYEEFVCRLEGAPVILSVFESGRWSITFLEDK